MAELDSVYRLACHLSGAAEEAEDFVQEAFLRAFRSASTYVPGDNGMRPWLFKILHNVIYSRRASDRRQQSAVGAMYHERRAEPSDDAELPHPCSDPGAINWESVDDRLKAAIGELPMDNQVAFLLAAAEGLKYREIAEVTGVPLGTVMSRLFRAREALVANLSGLAAELRLNPPRAACPKSSAVLTGGMCPTR